MPCANQVKEPIFSVPKAFVTNTGQKIAVSGVCYEVEHVLMRHKFPEGEHLLYLFDNRGHGNYADIFDECIVVSDRFAAETSARAFNYFY